MAVHAERKQQQSGQLRKYRYMDFDDGVVLIMAFDVPSPAPRGVEIIEEFRGVDLNSSPTVVSKYRSPEAPNMMRDIPGKVRKRQGVRKAETLRWTDQRRFPAK